MDTEQPDTQRQDSASAQSGIPPTIAQLIEQKSVRFTAAVQAFRAELEHQLQAPEAEPMELGLDALTHLPAPQRAPRQLPVASEPATRSQAYPRRSGWWDQVWQQGQPVSYRSLVVIWIACVIVGFGVGVVLAFALR